MPNELIEQVLLCIEKSSMEIFVGLCIIPFLSALFIQAGQDEESDDHDFL